MPPPQAASGSGSPSISSDGRYVAFDSSDNTLVFGDTNAARDVFVRDAQAATTSRASVATSGTQSNANSVAPAIRGDGSVVAFSSDASNLVSGDTNALSDVFVRVQSAGPLQNTYGYDRLSRLTTASGPDGARTYTYDPAGNRASVASSGSTTYSYDRADRILSLQAPPTTGSSTRPPSTNDAGWTSGANAYVSDNLYATAAPAKNITTAIKVGTFGFDSAVPSNATITGVTVTVEWKVSTTASIATLGAQAYVSGVAVGTELVNAAEPTSDTTQSFTVPGLTRTQLLNAVFQVRVRATRGNSATAFTASLDVVSVKVDYTVPTTVAMASDADGNTTAKGADTFTFDQPNRLKSATVAGATETYAYDGDGVRFSRTVGLNPAIRYVSDVNTSLPVTLDDGTRKYVYGLGLAYDVSGSTIEVYHTDRLGSVRAITDATGAVTSTYRTDEYGGLTATTGSSTQPFGFTGEPHDATTLTYLRARYYDPSLGRFMTRDTWAGSSKSPDSLNRFAYAEDNPLSRVDHSGRATSRVLTNVAGLGVLMVGGAICVWSGACEVAAVVVAADALATGALEIATPAEEVATAAAIDASQAQQIIQNGVRVGSALQTDLFHTIPDQYVAQIARNGSVFRLLGDDGQVRTLVQMSVTLTSGRAGRVEWIVDAAGEITHQFFIADGAVNGVPIKP